MGERKRGQERKHPAISAWDKAARALETDRQVRESRVKRTQALRSAAEKAYKRPKSKDAQEAFYNAVGDDAIDSALAVYRTTRFPRVGFSDLLPGIDWGKLREIGKKMAGESGAILDTFPQEGAPVNQKQALELTNERYLGDIGRCIDASLSRPKMREYLQKAGLLDLMFSVDNALRLNAGDSKKGFQEDGPLFDVTEAIRKLGEQDPETLRSMLVQFHREDAVLGPHISSLPLAKGIAREDVAGQLALDMMARFSDLTWKAQQVRLAREEKNPARIQEDADFTPFDVSIRNAYEAGLARARELDVSALLPLNLETPPAVKRKMYAYLFALAHVMKSVWVQKEGIGAPEEGGTEDDALRTQAKRVLRAGSNGSAGERLQARLARMAAMAATDDPDAFGNPDISDEEILAAVKAKLGPPPSVEFDVPALEEVSHEDMWREWLGLPKGPSDVPEETGGLRGIANERYDATGGGYEFDGLERKLAETERRMEEQARIREERLRASNEPGIPDEKPPKLIPDPLEIPRDGAPLPTVSVRPGWRRARTPVGERGSAQVTPVEGGGGRNLSELTDEDLARILKEVEARSGAIGEQRKGILQKLSRLRGKFLLFAFVFGTASAIPNYTANNDTAVGGSQFPTEDARGDGDTLSEPELLTDDDFASEPVYEEPVDSPVAFHALSEASQYDFEPSKDFVVPNEPHLYLDRDGRVIAFGETSQYTDGDWQSYWRLNLPRYQEVVGAREVFVYGDDQRLYRYADGQLTPVSSDVYQAETLSYTFDQMLEEPTP